MTFGLCKKCIQLHYKMIAKLFKKLIRLIYHFKYFYIYMIMRLKYKFYVHWKSPKSDGWTHERVQCIVGVYTQSSVWFRLWRSVHRTIYAPESLETWYTIVLLLKYHIFYRFVKSIVSVHQRRKQDFFSRISGQNIRTFVMSVIFQNYSFLIWRMSTFWKMRWLTLTWCNGGEGGGGGCWGLKMDLKGMPNS